MKIAELLESASYDGRLPRPHHARDSGLRVSVTREQREKIQKEIAQLMRRRDSDDANTKGPGVVYTAPDYARTFPGELRVTFDRTDPRYDTGSLEGSMALRMVSRAIQKVFKEVLEIEVEPKLDTQWFANGMRYLDFHVGWK